MPAGRGRGKRKEERREGLTWGEQERNGVGGLSGQGRPLHTPRYPLGPLPVSSAESTSLAGPDPFGDFTSSCLLQGSSQTEALLVCVPTVYLLPVQPYSLILPLTATIF